MTEVDSRDLLAFLEEDGEDAPLPHLVQNADAQCGTADGQRRQTRQRRGQARRVEEGGEGAEGAHMVGMLVEISR